MTCPLKNTMNSQLRNKKGNLNKEPCGFTGACYSKRKRGGNKIENEQERVSITLIASQTSHLSVAALKIEYRIH